MTTIFTPAQILPAYQYRKSCRHYDPSRKISAEDFNYILELARLSPSSVGSEPWQIVVILAKKNVRYDSPFMLEGIQRRGITDPEAVGKTLEVYRDLQDKCMHILNDERALFDWCSKQTYIALANMMTGAALIGIDSCPIEGFSYDEMNRVLAETGAFDPAEWGVSVAATFGYRAQDIAPKARKPMKDVVTWLE